MTALKNRQILLVSRPTAEPSADNFRLVESPIRSLAEGEVLVRHHFLSVDPYMRARMSEAKSYAAPQPLHEVMIGGTVGEVVDSRSESFAPGDMVVGMGGWQEYAIVDTAGPPLLRKVDTGRIPLSAYLGAVGMPGVTAWYGLRRILAPKPGETIAVSAASGAVGSVVGQLARAHGVRAVGFAGGEEKCRYVTEQLGFDACIDYKAHGDLASLAAALKSAAPDGIHGYFENVGGMILDAVMLRANAFARIAVCGMIASYNGAPTPMSYPQLILTKRLLLQGFIISEHMDVWPEALRELGGMVAVGRLKYRESVAVGLESAPDAFLAVLSGRNFGKQLVRLV